MLDDIVACTACWPSLLMFLRILVSDFKSLVAVVVEKEVVYHDSDLAGDALKI